MKEKIKIIFKKRISEGDKLRLIKELIEEDTSNNYWINKTVKLEYSEYYKLREKYWEQIVELYIERLDWWLYKGKNCKSAYLTINNWILKDNQWFNKRKKEIYECSYWKEHKIWTQCNC